MGNPTQYGKALWYEEYADTILFQAVAPCYYQTMLVPLYHRGQPDQNAIDMALHEKIPPAASYLEKQIGDRNFLVGNQLSIADVAVVSMFINMYFTGFPLDSTTWPALSRYLEHHFARDSFASCQKDLEAELVRLRSLTSAA